VKTNYINTLVFVAIMIALVSLNRSISYSQPIRVAVIPFQNMDGRMDHNILSYQLQDSVSLLLKSKDPDGKHYYMVPEDSVQALLTELNVDPTNNQYPSDVWKVVKQLNVKYVVSGNFNLQDKNILINAYIYNAKTRLPSSQYQVRDIFLVDGHALEAVPIIVKGLLPALISN
jgi:TolB-like protein